MNQYVTDLEIVAIRELLDRVMFDELRTERLRLVDCVEILVKRIEELEKVCEL